MKGGDIMGKERDLIGQKFNRLTVLERAEDHIYPSGKHRKDINACVIAVIFVMYLQIV